jgi:integrase
MTARTIGRLSPTRVRTAKPPRGRQSAMLADGGCLYLQVSIGGGDNVRRSWCFRYERNARRHEMGLGPLHTLGLAEARDKARTLRQQLLDGIDPLEAKRAKRLAEAAEAAKRKTFRDCAEDYLALHLGEFRNAKHRQQWRSTLATYAYPKIGYMPIGSIGPADVLHCIEPIWNTRQETASRVRQRIKRILDYAATRELRTGDNPAAHVTVSLPKGKNGETHHAALPYVEVPSFMAELRQRDSVSARALELTVLCATRTSETIGASWREFDLDARIWTIPAARMKAGKAHKIPLSDRALEILRALPHHGSHVFPLSNMAMLELLRGMRPGLTVHGFRSTFMDWCHERTSYPKVAIDMALAHKVADKVEAAYRRGDLFAKRAALMSAWAGYCSKPVAGGDVVPIRNR